MECNITNNGEEQNDKQIEAIPVAQRTVEVEVEVPTTKTKARRSRSKIAQTVDVPAAVVHEGRANTEQTAKDGAIACIQAQSDCLVHEEQGGIPVHPLADIFPMMSDDEVKAMADDIRVNGQTHPIITWHGQVIDGRNRLAACRLAGVRPFCVARDDLEEDGLLHFIMQQNVMRRQLDEAARQVVAARLVNMRRGHAGAQRDGDPAKCGITVADAAAMLHVSPAGVERARQLLKAAPDLADQVVAGTQNKGRKMTTSGALEIAKRRTNDIELAPEQVDAGPKAAGSANIACAQSASVHTADRQRIADVVQAFRDAVQEAQDCAKAMQGAQLRPMLLRIAMSIDGWVREFEAALQAGLTTTADHTGLRHMMMKQDLLPQFPSDLVLPGPVPDTVDADD